MRPLDFQEHARVRSQSIVGACYDREIDRSSAYEQSLERAKQQADAETPALRRK